MISEAMLTGNLSYRFLFPVAEIKQNSSQVEVRSRSGQTVFADHMICTILLNVLSDVKSDKRSTL
jgi:monoamine oxidase